jgi:phage-related minor tail protein
VGTDIWAKAQDGFATSLANAKEKSKALADQLQRQLDKLDALYPKQYDAVQAHFDYADAVAASDEAIKGLNDRSKDQQDELDNAKEKILDTAKQYATMDGAAEGSQGAIARQIESLKNQEDALAPNSPLRKFLDEYIAALAAIPSNISTIMDLHISSDAVNSGATSDTTRGKKARASGGPVSAGEQYLVGEKGPEIVRMGGNGTVYTAGETAGMLGGGGNIYNVTVNGANMTPNELVAAIKQYEKRNGPGWRS